MVLPTPLGPVKSNACARWLFSMALRSVFVIASYEKGSIWNYKPDSIMEESLNSEEQALLNLLTSEDIAEVVA